MSILIEKLRKRCGNDCICQETNPGGFLGHAVRAGLQSGGFGGGSRNSYFAVYRNQFHVLVSGMRV